MWNNSFNSFTCNGSSIMVKAGAFDIGKADKFEELLSEASHKANELKFKKLVLKSLRMNVEDKDPKEIEGLYSLYVMSLYNDC